MTLAGTHIVPDLHRDAPMQYNVALGYLASYCQERVRGLGIDLKDFPITVGDPLLPEGTAERILERDPEIVGISSYCWDLDAFRSLIPRIKKLSPSARIVVGGPSATFGAPELMRRFKEVDLAVCGEGEATLAELLGRGLARAADIPGLFVRDGDAVRSTGPREPMKRLADIPSPFMTGVLRPNKMNLMTGYARGCVNKCRHCAWKHISGGIRYQGADYIRSELRWASRSGYRHVFIFDSALNYTDARLREVTAAVRDSAPGGKMLFSYFLDHHRVNPAQMRMLRGVATNQILIGLESLGREAARTLGRRPVDRKAFARSIKMISEAGPVVLCTILGIPGDTAESFLDTIDFAADLARDKDNRIAGIRIFWDVVTPGSLLHRRRQDYGIRIAKVGIPYMLSCDSFGEQGMVHAFDSLLRHPAKGLFIWEDADPRNHYRGLKDFSLGAERSRLGGSRR
jgi:radical SAM superfamily enzyme YgiQ (UPF0313 family)